MPFLNGLLGSHNHQLTQPASVQLWLSTYLQ